MSSTPMSDFNESEYVEVKDLYQAISGSRSWNARWSEYKDPGEENKNLQPYRASFPIIHKWKCTDEKEGVWATDSVEINDKVLRTKVEEILSDVPGLNFDVDVLAFKPPFAPFLHKWPAFRSAVNSDSQDTKLQHLLQHLFDIVAPVVSPTLEKINKACKSQTIDWQLFKSSCVPGELIYGSWFSKPQAYKIVGQELYWGGPIGTTEFLKLEVEYHDWDGQKSGFRQTEFHIEEFRGEVPLTNLEQVPFKFLKREETVREELIARGKKFENMIGYHFKHYSGTKFTKTPSGMRKGQLNARIVVDAYAYHKFYDEQWIDDKNKQVTTPQDHTSAGNIIIIEEEQSQDGTGRNEVIKPFSEEQHLLSISTVKAFDIDNREWCQVYLDGFSEIVFNDNAYDKLVLDDSEKEMILAFSEQVRDRSEAAGFDDFIKNKGRGILMLLCGSPGVGKTLTAESVAERAHVPLYAVNAGEIGHDADAADDTLRMILECCRLWNAVLLLDEADVFLEARGTDSLTRNELVSVFLRRLEYFGGLSFLTTNRPRSIDPAFESRLDLIIPYPDLDKAARRAVWVTFVSQLDASRGHAIGSSDYDKLADHKCNGREIKNIVKISAMLAHREKSKLKMSHIATVLRLRIKAAKTVRGPQFD